MTDAERLSRESFYGNLVWVVDGRPFRENFDIFHMLPDPTSELARDLVWQKATRQAKGAAHGIFWRRSESLEPTGTETRIVEIHSIRKIEEAMNLAYIGHHQYDWIRPRRIWLDATCPVYIDFGDEFLVRLETYDKSGLPCIRFVAKQKFIHDAMAESSVEEIATRYYPII